jgi:UDP-glucose 4-epimerase
MNVGTGRGASVREVIKLVCEAAGRGDVVAVEEGRRAGDPAFLCADVSLIKKKFVALMSKTLTKSVESIYGV